MLTSVAEIRAFFCPVYHVACSDYLIFRDFLPHPGNCPREMHLSPYGNIAIRSLCFL